MAQTVRRMGGDGLTRTELADLEQFLLHGLEAPVNPWVGTELTAEQADYIGVPQEGPYKPEHYRY